jgi:hypothetical protein
MTSEIILLAFVTLGFSFNGKDVESSQSRKMWRLHIHFLLIFEFAAGKDYAIPLPANYCNENTLTILKVIFLYFEDVHELTMVDLTSDNMLNSFQCINGNNFGPIISRTSNK